MFKKVILITTLLAQNSMAIAQSSDIQSWEEKIIPKGYILSLDLQKNMECGKIWSKQIKEFKKMNPKKCS